MNVDVLGTLSGSVDQAMSDYGPSFGAVYRHDTSNGDDVKASNVRLASAILDSLETFLNPEILVVPRREIEGLSLEKGGSSTTDNRNKMIQCVIDHGKPMRRSEAEADPNYVQIIACGVLVHKNEVFLFQRKERDPKYRLYGKATIWQGTHVPTQTGKQGLDLLKVTLVERITRSLFLSRQFKVEPIGYCWDAEDENSSPHFGVIFRVNIDNDFMAADLRRKEFRKGRGHGLAGSFVDWEKLRSMEAEVNLESWSLAILRNRRDFHGLQEEV